MKKKIFLYLIIILFLTTRVYKISDIPPSLYWDEASIGYNAYSILKTDKDEWGNFLPLEFKAFGEYKLPVYIYTLVPFLAIFGPTEWVVRIPSVLFSLGSTILIYFLAKKIFNNDLVGLFASFIFSISPWYFIFSRTGFEASAGLFFYLLANYFFLRSPKNVIFLLFSVLSFVISMYSYNSFRILAPITVVILFLLHIKELKAKNWIYVIIPVSLFLIISFITFNSALLRGERLSEIGIFNTSDKKVVLGNFLKNYLSHFSFNFLILKGDTNLRNQQPGFGELYLLEIPLMLAGIYFILKSRQKIAWLPLYLLLISPIPAAITRESPHALRAIAAVPFIAILGALGIYQLYIFTKLKLVPIVLIFLLLISFLNYYKNFLFNYSRLSSKEWQFGYRQVTDYVSRVYDKYDHIIISDYNNQPYIFVLYFLKYDPAKFLIEAQRNTGIRKETSVVKSFDKFIFSSISFYDFPEGKSLIFAHPSERMDEIHYKETIQDLNGSLAFYVYEYEKK